MGNLPDFNPLSLLDQVPGVKQLEEAARALGDIADSVGKVAGEVSLGQGLGAVRELAKHPGHAEKAIAGLLKPSWAWFSQYGAGTLFKEYLVYGLGLSFDKLNSEAKTAINTIDTMLAFSTAFPLVIKAADLILDFFLGQRAPKLAESALGHIAEEMGLTWAMGMTIDRAFETAVGNKLEEAILHQKRPVDPELPVLRLMMRQHLIEKEVFEDRAAHMGYSDDWVHRFGKLADSLVPVGDLQQLWFYDLIKEGDVEKGLEALGFVGDDLTHLKTLYIDKAQTQGGLQLRSVARDLAVKGIFTVDQYKNVLQSTNMSPKEQASDLAALTLELEWGRTNTPVSAIKLRYQHGQLVDDTARPELKQLGYSDHAIAEMLASWKLGKLPHPMSASKVLTYWYSGVITNRHDAYTRLVETGLRDQDATFLLDHPPAEHARKYQLTPALIEQAYIDGAITQADVVPALTRLGVTEEAAGYMLNIATYRKARVKRPAGDHVPLSKAEVVDAWHVGVYTPQFAIDELAKLGYSPDDALTLLEIKAKGANPFAKGSAPLFPDLNAAIAYMVAHGYEVIPPADPMLPAAESVLAQHGYSYQKVGAGIATIPGGVPGYGGQQGYEGPPGGLPPEPIPPRP